MVLLYFDTLIYMNIGTARTNTPSSHPVRGHPATSALVSLCPFFRHRTAGLLRCYPFLHTAPGVPESPFPLRPRAWKHPPAPRAPPERILVLLWWWMDEPTTAVGTSAATPVGWRRRATATTPMLQQPESVNLNRSETREWRGPRGSRKAEDEES